MSIQIKFDIIIVYLLNRQYCTFYNNLFILFRLALALISNGNAKVRLKFLEKLSKYIQIDVFGKYFKKKDPCKREQKGNKACTSKCNN